MVLAGSSDELVNLVYRCVSDTLDADMTGVAFQKLPFAEVAKEALAIMEPFVQIAATRQRMTAAGGSDATTEPYTGAMVSHANPNTQAKP